MGCGNSQPDKADLRMSKAHQDIIDKESLPEQTPAHRPETKLDRGILSVEQSPTVRADHEKQVNGASPRNMTGNQAATSLAERSPSKKILTVSSSGRQLLPLPDKMLKESGHTTNNNNRADVAPSAPSVPPRQNVRDFVVANGVYTGEMFAGCQDGWGTCYYPNGDWYEGQWQGGYRHGKGVNKTHNGVQYEGEWDNDRKHGRGKQVWTKVINAGASYDGDWFAGLMHGFGTHKFSDGASYAGQYDSNKRNGKGTWTFANGDTYTGSFVNDMPSGKGILKEGGIEYNVEYDGTALFSQGAKPSRMTRADSNRRAVPQVPQVSAMQQQQQQRPLSAERERREAARPMSGGQGLRPGTGRRRISLESAQAPDIRQDLRAARPRTGNAVQRYMDDSGGGKARPASRQGAPSRAGDELLMSPVRPLPRESSGLKARDEYARTAAPAGGGGGAAAARQTSREDRPRTSGALASPTRASTVATPTRADNIWRADDEDAAFNANDALDDDVTDDMDWDVFLNYRVDADAELVEKLYDKLCNLNRPDGKGRLRIFWDKKCLVPGLGWEEGFVRAVCNSRVAVLVMSRKTFLNPPKYDMTKLNADSRGDNVLLEYDLILELFDLGRVKAILPLLVGDLKHDADMGGDVYTHFFSSGCLPSLPDVHIPAVQAKALGYLRSDPTLTDSLSPNELRVADVPEGTPSLVAGRTVKQTIAACLSFQGHFLCGPKSNSVEDAVNRVWQTNSTFDI